MVGQEPRKTMQFYYSETNSIRMSEKQKGNHWGMFPTRRKWVSDWKDPPSTQNNRWKKNHLDRWSYIFRTPRMKSPEIFPEYGTLYYCSCWSLWLLYRAHTSETCLGPLPVGSMGLEKEEPWRERFRLSWCQASTCIWLGKWEAKALSVNIRFHQSSFLSSRGGHYQRRAIPLV